MACESDPYIFSTNTMPPDPRFLPPMANGLLGWRVYNNIMHMGGVYNGEGGRCHRADVPCPLAVTVETEEPAVHTYSLDTHTGAVVSAMVPNTHILISFLTVKIDPCVLSLSRCVYTHSEHSQRDCLTVSVRTPTLSQLDGY